MASESDLSHKRKRKHHTTEPDSSKLKKRKRSKAENNEPIPDTSNGFEAEKDAKLPDFVPLDSGEVDGGAAEKGYESETQSKRQRFILFIGNLPSTATSESIAKHFEKIKPKAVRHRTKKDTSESKGFAFLEFDSFDRLKSCLKLYHRSVFDDGQGQKRKLNVELTAGGGGSKSVSRKEKLQAKNTKLRGERKRKSNEERVQKRKQKREKAVLDEQPQQAETHNDIHPSRRSRFE